MDTLRFLSLLSDWWWRDKSGGDDSDSNIGCGCECDKEEKVFIREVKQRLDRTMIQQKLYLDHDITIVQVAKEVGTNRTYISKAIHANAISFFEYVNEYRIEHVINLLKEEGRKEHYTKTIPDIAYEAGFSNERTMNKYLLKKTGMRASDIRSGSRK